MNTVTLRATDEMQSLAPQADAEVTSSAPPAQAELPEASPARQAGDSVAASLARLGRTLSAPLLGIMIFLGIWGVMAPRVDTSLGALPGPVDRKSGGEGKSVSVRVDLGGRRIMKNKKITNYLITNTF